MAQAAIDETSYHLKEFFKVSKSFLYFLITFCWIEDKNNARAIPFALWPSQRAILEKFLTAPRLMILKARQLGLTWLTAAYALWLCITKPLQLVVVISAKEDWAIEFLDRVKFIMKRLPDWLVPLIKKDSGQELTFILNGYESTIKSLTTTVEGAQSKTPTLLVLDETARNRYIRSIYNSSKPGIDAGGGRIIAISNAIKDGVGWFWTRNIFTGSMNGTNDFERIFMPWFDHPHRPKDFIKLQLLGGMDPQDIPQHYPSTEQEAISALTGSYFGDSLGRFEKLLMPGHIGRFEVDRFNEVDFVLDSSGIVELWRYPYNQHVRYDGVPYSKRYCAGSDVSEGVGQTNSVAYTMDRLHDELICKIKSNRIPAHDWAVQLDLMHRYYDRALTCVERNGPGMTCIQILNELKPPANQYAEIIPGQIGPGITKRLGYQQNDQKKYNLSEWFRKWIRETDGGFYDIQLMEECGTWIKYEGKHQLGPQEGALGDHVIGASLAVEASRFLEGPPTKHGVPVEGWRARWLKGEL